MIPPDYGCLSRTRSFAFNKLIEQAVAEGDLTRAAYFLDKVERRDIKFVVSLKIAKRYTQQGRISDADDMLSYAKSEYEARPEYYKNNTTTIAELAMLLVAVGDTAGAIEIARLASASYVTAAIVSEMSARGDLRRSAQAPAGQSASAFQIGKKPVARGDLEAASDLAGMISDGDKKNDVYMTIGSELSEQANFSAAGKIADRITDSNKRIDFLLNMALDQLNAGYLSAYQANAGEVKRRISLIANPLVKAKYACLATGRTDLASARELIADAYKTALQVTDPKALVEVLATNSDSIARTALRFGMPALASEALKSSAAVAKRLARENGLTLSQLAVLFAELGDFPMAEQCAEMLHGCSYHGTALAGIGKYLTHYGNLRAAETIAASISDNSDRVYAYYYMVEALAARGDTKEAIRIAGLIDDAGWRKNNSFDNIAAALAKAGDLAQARKYSAMSNGDPISKLFEAMTKAGDIEWATRALAKLKSGSWPDNYCRFIVDAQAAKGDFVAARATAKLLVRERFWKYLAIKSLAEAGDTEGSLELVRGMSEGDYQPDAYVSVIGAFYKKGMSERMPKH